MNTIRIEDVLENLAEVPPVVGLQEASRATGLSPTTLRRRVRSGELRALRARGTRGWRLMFMKRDLAQLLLGMAS